MSSYLKSVVILFVLLASSFANAERNQRVDFAELQKILKDQHKGALVEIFPGPKVLVTERRYIKSFLLKDVQNRLFVAQNICDPDKQFVFPDGSQGQIVCWLKK